jgi:hypothetical protein
MRKIIGFKIQLRAREISRRAKKTGINLGHLSETELLEALSYASKSLKPGVLFETFGPADPDAALLSPLPGLAFSLVLVTLGSSLQELSKNSHETHPAWEPLWPLVCEVALEECQRFVSSLIDEEASLESCELGPITTLNESPALAAVLMKLDGSKIAVALRDGQLLPSASAAFSLSWLSKSKAQAKAKAR